MKVRDLTFIGLLTAFLCITAPLSLPIGVIPVSLASFSVFLVSAVAEKKGICAVILYVLFGIFGLPVFSGFTGGFQQLIGVTGGFIVGYIAASAFLAFFLKNSYNIRKYFCTMFTANIIIYVLGILWFMYITNTKLLPALSICVFPFVITDIIKAMLVAYLSLKVKKRLEKAWKL